MSFLLQTDKSSQEGAKVFLSMLNMAGLRKLSTGIRPNQEEEDKSGVAVENLGCVQEIFSRIMSQNTFFMFAF